MKTLLIIIVCLFSVPLSCQETVNKDYLNQQKKFLFGIQAGAGWAYEDEAHLFNTLSGLTIDYKMKNDFYIQFAPQYTWLWKWNEHYLTLPIHLRKRFGNKFSLFAGPALTFDVGYFKDLGVSVGAYYQLSKRSSLVLSTFTFTLYDYLYVPISVSYHINIVAKNYTSAYRK